MLHSIGPNSLCIRWEIAELSPITLRDILALYAVLVQTAFKYNKSDATKQGEGVKREKQIKMIIPLSRRISIPRGHLRPGLRIRRPVRASARVQPLTTSAGNSGIRLSY